MSRDNPVPSAIHLSFAVCAPTRSSCFRRRDAFASAGLRSRLAWLSPVVMHVLFFLLSCSSFFNDFDGFDDHAGPAAPASSFFQKLDGFRQMDWGLCRSS